MGPIVLQLAKNYENQEHRQNHETSETSKDNSFNSCKSDRNEEDFISYETSIYYIKDKGYDLPSFLQDGNKSLKKSNGNELTDFYGTRKIYDRYDKTCENKQTEEVEKGIFD